MMLERRDQQNAADAAAIAASRYILTDATAALQRRPECRHRERVHRRRGVAAGDHQHPAPSGPNVGNTDYIEVQSATRVPRSSPASSASPHGPWARARWGPTSTLRAAPSRSSRWNRTRVTRMLVSGNGTITAYGNIQVNSVCNNGALRRQGGGDITVDLPSTGACNVVGDIKDGGGQGEHQSATSARVRQRSPTRSAKIGQPAKPITPTPTPTQEFGSMTVPDGCPGGASAGTGAGPGRVPVHSSYAGEEWRLYPGLYPGGIKLQGGTFYLEPGIYYLGGGGLDITGNGTVIRLGRVRRHDWSRWRCALLQRGAAPGLACRSHRSSTAPPRISSCAPTTIANSNFDGHHHLPGPEHRHPRRLRRDHQRQYLGHG